jgi:peptide/nickel transport system substrate-binding protein
VTDATSRVSALQAGQVDVSSGLPLRDTMRLNQVSGLQGKATPTIDTYLIHMVNNGPTTDKNVRLAMHHAINKEALVRAFFNNVPAVMSTPASPGTPAFNPAFKFPYDQTAARTLLAASGYSQAKPVRIKFFSANGAAPSDYDMARAIVQMWKEVGIEAEHTVIEPAQFYSQSAAGTLQGPMLWLWQNGSGDPALSEGSYLDPKQGFSVWRSPDVSVKLDPLLSQLDQTKRIEGYKAFDQWVVEQGYSLPLMQGIATAAYKKEIAYKPFKSGWVLPDYWKA